MMVVTGLNGIRRLGDGGGMLAGDSLDGLTEKLDMNM